MVIRFLLNKGKRVASDGPPEQKSPKTETLPISVKLLSLEEEFEELNGMMDVLEKLRSPSVETTPEEIRSLIETNEWVQANHVFPGYRTKSPVSFVVDTMSVTPLTGCIRVREVREFQKWSVKVREVREFQSGLVKSFKMENIFPFYVDEKF